MSELSETITNQRKGRTCAYHALSKILVQNVFQYIIPKEVNSKQFVRNECNKYLDDEVFKTSVATLTPEECSPGGYDRILQFLYVYHIISENNKVCEEEKPVGFLEIGKTVSSIWEKRIPSYFDKSPHARRMSEMLGDVNDANDLTRVKYISRLYRINIPLVKPAEFSKMVELIRKSIRKGLYVYIGLQKRTDGIHKRHAVHVVATFRNKLVIKNSWGDGTYEVNIDDGISLKKSEPYRIYQVGFLIPVPAGFDIIESKEFFVGNPNQPGVAKSNFMEEADELSEIIDEVTARPNGKELRSSINVQRGDAVSTQQGVGIFLEEDLMYGGVDIFPDMRIDGKFRRVDVRTVPDALELLTSLVEFDKETMRKYSAVVVDKKFLEIGLGKRYRENLEQSSLALEKAKEQFGSSLSSSSSSISLAESAVFKRGEAIKSSEGLGIFTKYRGRRIEMYKDVNGPVDSRGPINRVDIGSVPNGIEIVRKIVQQDKENLSRSTPENEAIHKKNLNESTSMLVRYLASSSSASSSSASSASSSTSSKKANSTRRRR